MMLLILMHDGKHGLRLTSSHQALVDFEHTTTYSLKEHTQVSACNFLLLA